MLKKSLGFLTTYFSAMRIHIEDPDLEPVIDNISDFLTSPWEILEPVVCDEFD